MTSDHARLARERRSVAPPPSVAECAELGVTIGQLRGRGWRRTSFGCYVPAEAGLVGGVRTPLQRIIEALPLVPAGGAMTGWPAAYLAAVTTLDGRSSDTLQELPIPICVGRDVGRERRGDWHFVRDRLPAPDVRVVTIRVCDVLLGDWRGLRVRTTVPARACFDGARMAADLGEAVAFLDAGANAGWLDLTALSDYAIRRAGARGVGLVRQAVDLADAAARSPWESRLRVVYVVVAGLPRPQVNVPIFDLDGRLLGIADLLDEEAGLVTEFDGRRHRERHQHRGDNDREELFEDANLVVARADSLDMTRYAERLVARLRSGRRRGLQRDRGLDGWTTVEPAWWVEQRASVCLSDQEKAELYGG